MAFFSSTTSISLGLAFTSHNVLGVRLDQERGIVLRREQLEPDSLVNGVIENEQGVVKPLVGVVQTGEDDNVTSAEENAPQAPPVELQQHWWQKIFSRFLRKGRGAATDNKGAAICLPPEAVYTALFAIPSVVGKDLEAEVTERLRKVIPVNPEDMVYLWQQVGKTDEHQHIGVAAMSTKQLMLYKSLCERQKLRLEAVSTPASVIWLSAAEHQKQNAVLISRLPAMTALSSFVYNHWPVDEVVLPADASLEDHIQETAQMIEEQEAMHGVAPERIVFIGSDEEFAELQESDAFDVPVERTTFDVPERLEGYELGLFSILSARKDKLVNLLEGSELEEE